MSFIKLSIVTPFGEIFNEDVKSIILPGKDGEFGVLPGHSSLVSSLDVGILTIEKIDNTFDNVAINWGYVNVSESTVDVLLDNAVSLNSNDSDLSEKIKQANDLVSSVKESNASITSIKARLSSIDN